MNAHTLLTFFALGQPVAAYKIGTDETDGGNDQHSAAQSYCKCHNQGRSA